VYGNAAGCVKPPAQRPSKRGSKVHNTLSKIGVTKRRKEVFDDYSIAGRTLASGHVGRNVGRAVRLFLVGSVLGATAICVTSVLSLKIAKIKKWRSLRKSKNRPPYNSFTTYKGKLILSKINY
jgi:hypothetical protein